MEQHSEINPGYTAKVSSKKLDIDVGPIIRCPRCKKPLMEGFILTIVMRCKHCGKWVFLKRI